MRLKTLQTFRRAAVVVAVAVGLLAFASQANAVSKSQREAVLFVVDLSAGASGLETGFYQAVTFAAVAVGQTFLTLNYSRVTTVEHQNATLTGLTNALKAAANRSNVKAVDLIFVTHGFAKGVAFADGLKSSVQVQDGITSALSASQRANLRIVFSTACFGESHRANWRAAGFKAASGSQKIYADSALSYPAFLTSWTLGNSFRTAVDDANNADLLRLSDNAAKEYFKAKKSDFQHQVDSFRVRSGDSAAITINSAP